MKKMIVCSIVAMTFSIAPFAHAGKVEDVQKAVKGECSKDVDSSAALRMVKALFLDCVPGSKVDVADACKMSCLKQNAGAVVGQ